jgi:pimeloyl-ACP methyl ester carboxylesterase
VRRPIHHPTPPEAPPPWTPEARTRLFPLEVLSVAAIEVPRLTLRAARLVRGPRAEAARTVVTVPGFGAGELTMAPIGRWLRSRGHTIVPWGLGVNRGDPEGDTERLLPRIRTLADAAGAPVALVGWSLGGVIAREVARAAPDLVDRVVTYGTPCVGGPTYTAAAGFWGPEECARIAAETADRDATDPVQADITAIFSRADRVVAWPASIDRTSPRVHHVEVGASHAGLGLDPDVWAVVADAL